MLKYFHYSNAMKTYISIYPIIISAADLFYIYFHRITADERWFYDRRHFHKFHFRFRDFSPATIFSQREHFMMWAFIVRWFVFSADIMSLVHWSSRAIWEAIKYNENFRLKIYFIVKICVERCAGIYGGGREIFRMPRFMACDVQFCCRFPSFLTRIVAVLRPCSISEFILPSRCSMASFASCNH